MNISSANTSPPRTELDSHDDTCCVGANAFVLYEWPDRTVDVTGFLDALGTVTKAPIVTAVIAYDDPNTGVPYLLIIHQAIYFPTMQTNLLCPNQLQQNGVEVEDCPRAFSPTPTKPGLHQI